MDSGVFSPVGRSSPPIRRSMFVSSAGRRPAASRIAREQERRRRLAVRPGDARDVELVRRVAEELVRGDGHRRADARDAQLRHRHVDERSTTSAAAPARDRLGRQVVAVDTIARDAEEERARRDRARVVGEVGDLERSRVRDLDRAERRDQTVEVHRAET